MKSKEYKYKCVRCGDRFKISHEVDTSGAVCTPCFEIIRDSNTYQEYVFKKKPVFRGKV